MPATATHCPYCSLQCGIALRPTPSEVRLEPTGFDVNRGGLCAKGWTAAELLDHPDRLLPPLVRKDPADRAGPLREATWDEALGRIVTAIRNSQRRYGKDSVGGFGGGGLTNEKAYALGKFVRVALGSASIDYNGRFCMSSAATAANRAFGVDRGLPFPIADLAGARTVLLVGANPADTMPPPCSIWTPDARPAHTTSSSTPAVRPPPGARTAISSRCPAFSGVGNGSTYKMIPAIFRARHDDEHEARRLSGAVIGIAGAIGAFGGVLVNLAFRQSFLAYGSADAAYLVFIVFYALCVVVTWAVYLRRPPGPGRAARRG